MTDRLRLEIQIPMIEGVGKEQWIAHVRDLLSSSPLLSAHRAQECSDASQFKVEEIKGGDLWLHVRDRYLAGQSWASIESTARAMGTSTSSFRVYRLWIRAVAKAGMEIPRSSGLCQRLYENLRASRSSETSANQPHK